MTPHLDMLAELNQAVEEYTERHDDAIKCERKDASTSRILEMLPPLLAAGIRPLCRNGSVCEKVTPCIELLCPYKKSKDDVVSGCSKCNSFQLAKGWNVTLDKGTGDEIDYWTERLHQQ